MQRDTRAEPAGRPLPFFRAGSGVPDVPDDGWADAPHSVRIVRRLVQLADGPRSRLGRVAVAVGVAAIVTVSMLLATPMESAGTQERFVYPTLAVVVVAWIAGFKAAFLSALLFALAIGYFWVDPKGALDLSSPSTQFLLLSFVAVASLLSGTIEALRSLERRSRRQAALLRERGRMLEESVRRAEHSEQVAVEAEQRLRHFLAMMSHELRTPLTAIIGYGELLAEGVTGPVTEAQAIQLARIKASASHLLQLINEMLLLSKIEAGKETLHIEPVRVDDVLREVEEHARALLAGKPIELLVPPVDRTIVARTDHLKLRQILLNLVSNAVKYTDRGEIVVVASLGGDRVYFEVRDTGVGISPADLDHIWDAYWQADGTLSRRRGGTGLGLSLVKRIASLLGGDARVISTQGVGSTFVVTIPLRPSPAMMEGNGDAPVEGTSATIALMGE